MHAWENRLEMARFLFVGPPLTGHTNPTVPVARALEARGHECAWAGHETAVGKLRPHGSIWLMGLPVLAVAALADRILFPLVSRIAPGNNMRVLARRREAA